MAELGPGVRVSGLLISEEIGQGGFSRVFRAEPEGGGPAVAVKVAVRPELVAAFRAEGAILRRLEGERFVRVLEQHLDADPPYFVLELCPGGDVRALLDRSPAKRLPPGRVLLLARAILEGVAFAHGEGVVHGDLKPENLLLDAAGEPRIADLGLSRVERRRLLDVEAEVAPSLETAPAEGKKVRGTFDYLAPEVRKGGDVTPASDVFALGVLLYEMLVGERPVGAFRMPAAILAREGVEVPAALDRVIGRALAHEARNRYEDAGQMRRDLESGEQGIELVRRDPGRARAEANPILVAVASETFEDRAVSVFAHSVLPAALVAGGAAAGLDLAGAVDAAAFPAICAGFALAGGLLTVIPLWAGYRAELLGLERAARRELAGRDEEAP